MNTSPMLEPLKAAILDHARAEMPREACGLIVLARGRARYWPCRNTAPDMNHFVLAPEDYAAAADTGEIVAVVHSHPHAPVTPSEADRVACEASGLPWHIVAVPSELWRTLLPTGYRAPLVGRPFAFGVLDCYSLVRDYFRETLDLALPEIPRTDKFWERGENLYLDHLTEAGFAIVADGPRPHDGILMQIGSPLPNHAAVYLGDGIILHHLAKRLSCREVYGGFYAKVTTHIVRHNSFREAIDA